MGKLIQLGLPIGNIEDTTLRVKHALQAAQVVICEDTRVTKSFCKDIEVSLEGKRFISFHDHSGDNKLDQLINMLEEGDLYLCSDAGSPAISDPAYPLIKKAIESGFEIETFPGPTSPMVALELSGLPAIPSHFHGFLPRDKGARKKSLESFKSAYGTHIFFEGVSRVKECLSDIKQVFKNESIVVARELTKSYQSVYRFKASDAIENSEKITYKGEFVILVNIETKSSSNSELDKLAADILSKGSKPKLVAKLLSAITGENAKDIYQKLGKS